MKITIIRPDYFVMIDGEAHYVSMDGFPVDIHAIQWNENTGHIEYTDGRSSEKIKNIDSSMQLLIGRWQQAKNRRLALEADPFYEDDLAAAKLRKSAMIEMEAREKKALVIENATFVIDELHDINGLLSLALIKKAKGDNSWKADVTTKEIDPDTGKKTKAKLSADDILTELETIFLAHDAINLAAQTCKDDIDQLTDVAAIRDYPIVVE